ncbi:hypothetical protein [Streptomyces albipurpureus]|uniref:Uncharacterized protein n=1 Tax=Streptomyces albipurpureus TaxID=2897419 RepID=A0ABT0V0W6_9ACTN|nr:hypothetical protein [Streptomyces sp. CWNU-1]MCM2394395.1 hypothetical protein [Streptomyces sp. CWNU-1]
MTRTIPLQHPLDDTGLPVRQVQAPVPAKAAPPPAAAADTSRYDHPLFVRVTPGQYGGWVYSFGAFTGREERPEMPAAVWGDKAVAYEQRRELGRQYAAAQVMWSKARLRAQAQPLLREAAPLWEAWQAAHAELQDTFRAFWNTPDGRWRAQLLRLTDAERAARAAATAWDRTASELAWRVEEQLREAGEDNVLALTVVAREIGLDASGWEIAWAGEYGPGRTPMVEALNGEIAAQRDRLAEVARLAGAIETAQQPA